MNTTELISRSISAGPVIAQQAFDFSVLESVDYRDGNCCCDCITNILQPGIQRQEPLHEDLDSEIARKQTKQDNNEDNRRTRTLASGDLALQLTKRTSSDIPDVSGGTLFVTCDGFSRLSVDDRTEQYLPLQFGQLMQSLVKLLAHIHERVFVRSLRQILRPVKPAHIIIDRVAHFLW